MKRLLALATFSGLILWACREEEDCYECRFNSFVQTHCHTAFPQQTIDSLQVNCTQNGGVWTVK